MRLICVLCGDFNMTPETGGYRLVTTASLPASEASEWHCVGHSDDNEKVRRSDLFEERISCQEFAGVDLKLMRPMHSISGTPPYTNYTVHTQTDDEGKEVLFCVRVVSKIEISLCSISAVLPAVWITFSPMTTARVFVQQWRMCRRCRRMRTSSSTQRCRRLQCPVIICL